MDKVVSTGWSRSGAMMTILLLTCVPLVAPMALHARERDTVKACDDQSSLLLPTHPDLKTLEGLYQQYFGYSLPNLDLGLNQIEIARLLMEFEQRLERQRGEDTAQLSAADQMMLNRLKTTYSSAIAQVQSDRSEPRIKRSSQRIGLGVRQTGTARFGGGTQQSAETSVLSPGIGIARPARPSASRPSLIPAPSPSPIAQPKRDRSLPPNFNTEAYNRITDNPFFIPTQAPRSTFSVDVDTASYSNVRRFLRQGQLPPKDAVRIEELINYFSYDYAEPKADEPFSINTEVARAPWNPKHQLVQIGLKGRELKTRQPSNLVFLVDVSGSMRSPNKLQLLQRSLCMLTREMSSDDRVTLVTYAGQAGLVLPPTQGRETAKILKAIANLQAGGSTAGAAGISLAYDMAQKHFLPMGNNRVILATDGDFNIGISSDAELERLIEKKREQGVYLSVLGFGTGNYKDSKMETLADKGNGNYAYIDTLAEARKVLVEDLTSTLFTIAKDVKIQVEFNPKTVQAYRLIGYENRVLRDQDFNDDRKDAGDIGAGHTVTALYEVIPSGIKTDVALPTIDELKYQKTSPISSAADSDELMHVKLRYKQPDQTTSQLITYGIRPQKVESLTTSKNLQFAAAVAMFGMVMRDSEFRGNSTLETVTTLLNSLESLDPYQSEFQTLVRKAELIQATVKQTRREWD